MAKPDFTNLIIGGTPYEIHKETYELLKNQFEKIITKNFALPLDKPFVNIEFIEGKYTFTMPYKD